MAAIKTNVMRILESVGIAYTAHTYDAADGAIDGLAVAQKLGQDPDRVFKTLVTKGAWGDVHVFVLPVAGELNLKKAAAAAGEKAVAMIPVKDITGVTGYVRGGCSPIGMKKPFPVVLDETAVLFETIVFSGGKIGTQVELSPDDFCRITGAKIADLTD